MQSGDRISKEQLFEAYNLSCRRRGISSKNYTQFCKTCLKLFRTAQRLPEDGIRKNRLWGFDVPMAEELQARLDELLFGKNKKNEPTKPDRQAGPTDSGPSAAFAAPPRPEDEDGLARTVKELLARPIPRLFD